MSNPRKQVGTRALAAVVPDHATLLADPAGFLKNGELRIGGNRVSWRWFLLPPALFGLGMYLVPANFGYALAISSPILLGVMVYWAWPVYRELVLRSDGVEFRYKHVAVWCPWSLFCIVGHAFVKARGMVDTEIILPIAPEAAGNVKQLHYDILITKGRDVSAEQFRFDSADEVCLASIYEVKPQELGDLLLHIGRILGDAAADRGPPVQEESATAITAANPQAVTASPVVQAPVGHRTPPEPGQPETTSLGAMHRSGWITVPVTRLLFPPLCCDCCAPTVARYKVEADEGFQWWRLVPFVGRLQPEKRLEFHIPFCSRCYRTYATWEIVAGLLNLSLCLAPLGCLVGIAYWGLNVGVGLILLVITAIIARIAPFPSRSPFRARYDESTRSVSFRFRNGTFVEKMLAPSQGQ